jgi:flagellar basal-body rod modification protein FlgD
MTSASVMPATMTTLPSGSSTTSATSSASAASSGTLTEANFLTLLTTQLENQDPLNPQSPSDFAAELAQFSTASGVNTLNQTVTNSGGVQAASLIGKNVAVSGNALVLGSGGTAPGAFNLSANASDVQVAITNSSGSVVNTIDLGAMSSGNQTFSWNGQSSSGATEAAGTYSYTISTTAASNANPVTATPYAVVPVTSVVMGGTNGTTLDLGGGMAPVALSAVQEVY